MNKKLLLISFIFFIGIVSSSVCCEKKLGGDWCQPADSEAECDSGYSVAFSSCDVAPFCSLGCCFDESVGTCSGENSIQSSCVGDNLRWTQTCSENPYCLEGCCNIDNQIGWMTKGQCRVLADSLNREMVFEPETPQEECVYNSDEEGACILEDMSCRRTNYQDCSALEGRFEIGDLCSKEYPENTSCSRQETIGCGDFEKNQYEIYWYDSCGNRENIYEGNQQSEKTKSFNEGKIKTKEEVVCSPLTDTDCGKCDFNAGQSICAQVSPGEESVEAGDYICRNLQCEDSYTGKTWDNGNSWCVYEGFVGKDPYETVKAKQEVEAGNYYTAPEGKLRDPVGADHWRRYCENGEIKMERCGVARSEVCAYDANAKQATCRPNNAFNCYSIDNAEDCALNPDCMILPQETSFIKPDKQDSDSEGKYDSKSVLVDYYFRYNLCVPKVPIGWAYLTPPSDSTQSPAQETEDPVESLCNLANEECVVTKHRDCDACKEKKCSYNCACEGTSFGNNLIEECLSMGDCGAFVNTAGTYSDKGVRIEHSDYPNFEKDLTEYPTQEINEEENLPSWAGENTFSGTPGEELIKFDDNCCGRDTGRRRYTYDKKFTCSRWQPPSPVDEQTGEVDPTKFECNKCNNIADGIPCTAYKCMSLGSGCTVVAPDGYSEVEGVDFNDKYCLNMCGQAGNPNVKPTITPGEVANDQEYELKETGEGVMYVEKGTNEITEYTPYVNFTLETDVLSTCKYSEVPVTNLDFDDVEKMTQTREMGNPSEEHTFELDALPGYEEELVELHKYKLYVICQNSACGHYSNTYVVEFPLKKQPDMIPPIIISDPEGDTYMPVGTNTSTIRVVANEPIQECRYSFQQNTVYESMTNIFDGCCWDPLEEEQSCEEWDCSTEVPDLNNPVQETIYIKCSDISNVTNTEDNGISHNFIKSASSLQISSLSPTNGTVWKEWVNVSQPIPLSITTEGGAFEGLSLCMWKVIGHGDPAGFVEGEATTHTSSITGGLNENGIYIIEFKCNDSAGNFAMNRTSIVREIDLIPPVVTRVVKEGESFKITTNEEAKCYYDNSTSPGCGFILTSGIEIDGTYNLEHTINKNEAITNYHVKCVDLYGNENSGCAVIVRPTF